MTKSIVLVVQSKHLNNQSLIERTAMKALIIIDMQNDFLTGALGNDHCLAAIPEVVKLIQSKNWDAVAATMDTHDTNYMWTLEGNKLPVEHCIIDSGGWKLNANVDDAMKKVPLKDWTRRLQKPTFGSFDLIEWIRDEYENQHGYQARKQLGRGGALDLHFCGVCTSICVLANVVLCRAAFPDAKIVIHANACGDVTKEMHEAAKICFKAQQCEVVGED